MCLSRIHFVHGYTHLLNNRIIFHVFPQFRHSKIILKTVTKWSGLKFCKTIKAPHLPNCTTIEEFLGYMYHRHRHRQLLCLCPPMNSQFLFLKKSNIYLSSQNQWISLEVQEFFLALNAQNVKLTLSTSS